MILDKDYDYVRMYDSSEYAKPTLKVMLSIDLLGDISNPNCEWGELLSNEKIKKNIAYDEHGLLELIKLANEYIEECTAVSKEDFKTISVL